MGKKILIIGGNGFIGKRLCQISLEEGLKVSVFDKAPAQKEDPKITYITANLKEIGDAVAGFDYIVDLAGTTDNYAIKEGEPYRDLEANCTNTITLLEAVKKFNPKCRLLFASTFFVNGNVEKLPVTPQSPCRPLALYGATKLCAENFCHVYNAVCSLNIIIARFCNVYGPGEPGQNQKKAAFNFMIRQAVENKPLVIYNNFKSRRDYIYVDDLCAGIIVLLEKGAIDETYYIGTGKSIVFKDLIGILSGLIKANVGFMDPPDFHNKVGIVDFECDVSPIKALGWAPRVSYEEGITKCINYYKELLK